MKRVNVSDMIYDKIIEDFLSDKIDFGEKFVELEYAEKLSVSRTPLREAIKKLEHEGLIIRLQNGRLKFLEITKSDVIEIFNIRIALENMLLESCVENQKVLVLLKENIDTAEKHINDCELELAREVIKNFTKILYSVLHFEYTVKMLHKNNIILSKLKQRTLSPDNRTNQAQKEHIDIYNALLNNDIDNACKINRQHLYSARDIITKTM